MVAEPAAVSADDQVKKDYEEGKRFLTNGNLAQAAVALHNALLGFEERGDRTGEANACNQLGHTCLGRGDYLGAESHYRRAQVLCEEFGDPMSLFALAKKFIDVYRGQKKYDAAIAACLDVLDTYRDNNDPRGTVELLENMAAIYLEAGDGDKAADTYRTIARIHRNYKHQAMAAAFEEQAEAIETGR